ncbi:unnamed protein product, partial [Mesorhabditis belari]|uniref:tRNA selenocysteine-associated protein 1 n=1 Tax=Mesorhabditis belari TaxID=2138241 RepID=A0AAF3J744_9BILA
MSIVPPSVTLAGTRMRLFNQEDPRSLWMFTEEYYTPDMLLKVYNYYDLKPLNIRFINEKHTGKPSGYCFIDFSTPGECIHAMLRVYGQKVPYTNPIKKFSIAFARNPHLPEVDFVLLISNLPKDTDDAELFKMFLSRYPSCRSVRILQTPDGRNRGQGTVRFADYYEQQQAKDEFNGMEIRGHTLQTTATEAKIKLPRQMEGNSEGDTFVEHVQQQIKQLEDSRRKADLEKKLQSRMEKQSRKEATQRAKIGFQGIPLPTANERPLYEAIIYNPSPSVNEWNELFLGCDDRLHRELRESRYLNGGVYMSDSMMKSELVEIYAENSSDSEDTWSNASDDPKDHHHRRDESDDDGDEERRGDDGERNGRDDERSDERNDGERERKRSRHS